MRIVAFHLYNDFSGSPKVLRNVIEGLLEKKHKVTIVTSSTNGILDNLSIMGDINYDYFSYHPSNNKFLWLCSIMMLRYSI